MRAAGFDPDELSWLERNLPDVAVCEADRADKDLARTVVTGQRIWRASAEGRNATQSIMLPTRRVQARADDAQSRLLLANMGLVLQLAKRYRNKGIPLSDLVQEGSLGMLHAMQKYDPDRNVKFVTFAYYWVQQYLARALANKGYTIRLPVHVHEARRRISNARDSLAAEGNLAPSDEEVAEKARLPVRKLSLVHSVPSVVSLDSALHNARGATGSASSGGGAPARRAGAAGETAMADVIADPRQRTPDDITQERMFRSELDYFLKSTLEPRQYEILRLRYGLDDGRPKKAVEVSQRLGIEAHVIRRAEKSALNKLRKAYAQAMSPTPSLGTQVRYRMRRSKADATSRVRVGGY